MKAKAAPLVLAGCVLAALVTALLTVPWTVLDGPTPRPDLFRDFTGGQLAREQAFHEAVRPPVYLGLLLSLVLAGVLGLTSLGGRLVSRLPGGWMVQSVLAVAGLLTAGRLLTLPLDVQAERVLRRFGLSTQDWLGWSADLLKTLAISIGTTAVVVLLLLALARALPRLWWVPAAVLAAGLTVGGSFLYPLAIEPAFNDFTPLAVGQLRTDLLALAERDGVPVREVLVADASKRTTALNAYVSGFGSSRRIVVYDTLLEQSPPREVELVVAHELGHAKQQDVLHGTLIGAFAAAAGVVGLFLLLSSSRRLQQIGAAAAGDPRVLPFVLFLGVLAPLVLSPLTNLASRHVEARADLHSLELTGDVDTFIAVERRLSVNNLSDLSPSPLVYALFFTHPSGPERIAFAREWQRQQR